MIELTRFYSCKDRTIGRLQYEGATYYTIERPWQDNIPFKSCIPTGEYDLVRHDSPRFGPDCWMVSGVDDRSYILFHVANTERNVVGCIGLGMALYPTLTGVSQSRVAMAEFHKQTQGLTTERLVITEDVIR
tara:strand:+ start:138 stop:533 length:396 start_codon:yes stop_codon:yes gene_type:complete